MFSIDCKIKWAVYDRFLKITNCRIIKSIVKIFAYLEIIDHIEIIVKIIKKEFYLEFI